MIAITKTTMALARLILHSQNSNNIGTLELLRPSAFKITFNFLSSVISKGLHPYLSPDKHHDQEGSALGRREVRWRRRQAGKVLLGEAGDGRLTA